MSEVLDLANLVLGIIGTITGSIAIFIHFWRLRKESPRLEGEILKCEHDFAVSKSKIKTVSFWVELQIKNLGDRGTSINDIDLNFEDDGQNYHLKGYFRGNVEDSQRRWISPHETINISVDYWITFEGNDKEQIDCTFTIYHTHGSQNVKTISQKRKVTIVET